MRVSIQLTMANGYIKEISLLRMTHQREFLSNYTAHVVQREEFGESYWKDLEAAIKPMGEIINKNDDIIFASQKERDCFIHVAKRWLDVKILKRSRILGVHEE